MTDETTVTPPDEEPGGTASPEALKPDRAGPPTSMIPPTDDEATRTHMPPDEFATATDAQVTQADATPVPPKEVTSPPPTPPVFQRCRQCSPTSNLARFSRPFIL